MVVAFRTRGGPAESRRGAAVHFSEAAEGGRTVVIMEPVVSPRLQVGVQAPRADHPGLSRGWRKEIQGLLAESGHSPDFTEKVLREIGRLVSELPGPAPQQKRSKPFLRLVADGLGISS